VIFHYDDSLHDGSLEILEEPVDSGNYVIRKIADFNHNLPNIGF